MELPGYAILKEVARKRDITLGDARKFFTTDFNDKRDFFALASLYTGGYVDSSWDRKGCDWDTNKNSLVAEWLYLMSLGSGKHNVDDIPEFINDKDYNLEFHIYCTAKSDLFFHEQRSRRIDRICTLSIGILVALVAAAATAYLTKTIGVTAGVTDSSTAEKIEGSMSPLKLDSSRKPKTDTLKKTEVGRDRAQSIVPPDRPEQESSDR